MAATSAKQVETAKKTAEAVWVVEHATRMPHIVFSKMSPLRSYFLAAMPYELELRKAAVGYSVWCFAGDAKSWDLSSR